MTETISAPDPGGSWRPVPMRDTELTWRGRTYDLTNTIDIQELAGVLSEVDDDAPADDYVAEHLLLAEMREAEANERAAELQAQIDENRATTELYAALNRVTGMDRAQHRAAQLAKPSESAEILAAHRENYGDPMQHTRLATADLSVPTDEPQLDAKTAQIREHRRRHGI